MFGSDDLTIGMLLPTPKVRAVSKQSGIMLRVLKTINKNNNKVDSHIYVNLNGK
jgi:hypothetical protein